MDYGDIVFLPGEVSLKPPEAQHRGQAAREQGHGAGVVGDMLVRVDTAYAAGCDMLLVCNAPEAVESVLANWDPELDPVRQRRVGKLFPTASSLTWAALQSQQRYIAAQEHLKDLG